MVRQFAEMVELFNVENTDMVFVPTVLPDSVVVYVIFVVSNVLVVNVD